MFYFRGVETVQRASAALFGSLPHGMTEADVAGARCSSLAPESSSPATSKKPPDHQCYAHVDVGRAVRDFRDVKCQGTHAIVKMYGVTGTL